jgi:hypothetical protein
MEKQENGVLVVLIRFSLSLYRVVRVRFCSAPLPNVELGNDCIFGTHDLESGHGNDSVREPRCCSFEVRLVYVESKLICEYAEPTFP